MEKRKTPMRIGKYAELNEKTITFLVLFWLLDYYFYFLSEENKLGHLAALEVISNPSKQFLLSIYDKRGVKFIYVYLKLGCSM